MKLPEASRLEWSRRSSTDFVILYDWDSSAADLNARSVLQSLKDALYKVSVTLSPVLFLMFSKILS